MWGAPFKWNSTRNRKKKTNLLQDISGKLNLSPECCCFCSLTKSCLTLCDPMNARLPCPSLSSRVCSNSCSLSWWCHPTISSSVAPFSSCPQSFLVNRVFSNESDLGIRWPMYWSFSISPLNEYSELISFRIDWFDLLAVQGTLKSPPAPQYKSINSLMLILLYGSTLRSVHDYWRNHSFD